MKLQPSLKDACNRNPHLGEYLDNWQGEPPVFLETLDRQLHTGMSNILYPVGDPIFVHITSEYIAIEPTMNREEREKYQELRDIVLDRALRGPIPSSRQELRQLLIQTLSDSVLIENKNKKEKKNNFFKWLNLNLGQPKIVLSQGEFEKLRYFLLRDIIDSGPVEALIRDPYLEDIHSIGTSHIAVVHKIFGNLKTNISFSSKLELNNWLRTMGERIGRPIGESQPVASGTLPDGSRIAIAYSDDISRRGSSFTIRKFSTTPLSITQLIKWNTLSPEMAAYLWLCLENGMSIFLCGGTATGKTSALNSMLVFIDPRAKVLSAEDTTEVLPPQEVWQQLVTKEEGPKESQVDLFTLLRAALRSRPNYIIVGEILGEEGAVAFQAMQTGHPVLSTFHASSVRKMIQRFAGDPINVPVTFIDNLNVAMIFQAVYRGGKLLRRCVAIEEIEGYYEEAGGVVTRAVFKWNPSQDVHEFHGRNNSYILENKIAVTQGLGNRKEIYHEMERRAEILREMADREIFDHHQVYEIVKTYRYQGEEKARKMLREVAA